MRSSRGFANRRVLRQQALDLAQLDPVTVDLYLVIRTANEFQQTRVTPAHQVSGAVHTAAIAGEWVCDKAFRGELRALQITFRHTRTADVPLAASPSNHYRLVSFPHPHPTLNPRTP